MTVEKMQLALESNGLNVGEPERLAEKLCAYLEMLMDWNSRMDLIAPVDEDEAVDRHLIDSLSVLKLPDIHLAGRMADIGTGAGLPGLPLALALPETHVTLMDALEKRVRFLNAVVEALELTNVTVIHARAEDAAHAPHYREQYDVAMARAVASMPVLAEYLLPFVKRGGMAVCWKGPSVKEELTAGRRAAFILGATLEPPCAVSIEGRDWEHVIVTMRKTKPTPASYPRKAGTPAKKPLGVAEKA